MNLVSFQQVFSGLLITIMSWSSVGFCYNGALQGPATVGWHLEYVCMLEPNEAPEDKRHEGSGYCRNKAACVFTDHLSFVSVYITDSKSLASIS